MAEMSELTSSCNRRRSDTYSSRSSAAACRQIHRESDRTFAVGCSHTAAWSQAGKDGTDGTDGTDGARDTHCFTARMRRRPC